MDCGYATEAGEDAAPSLKPVAYLLSSDWFEGDIAGYGGWARPIACPLW